MSTQLPPEEQQLFQMLVTRGPCSRSAIKRELKGVPNLNALLAKSCRFKDGKYFWKEAGDNKSKEENEPTHEDEGSAYVFSGNSGAWTSSYLPPDMMSAVVCDISAAEEDAQPEVRDSTLAQLLTYRPINTPVVTVPPGDTDRYIVELHAFSQSQLSTPIVSDITTLDSYLEYLLYYNDLTHTLATTHAFLAEAKDKQPSIPVFIIDTLIAIHSRIAALEMELNRVVAAIMNFVSQCRKDLS
eukprot:TRINITY_DN12330_c0_g1_i1.p1 TRINITY_DN12330_c0_g1~~TRINITY_DN12330_c0_g1_i1.p1  ORF type:complete len:242 (+),score=27.25 TRINITY_DN12330_c0_g1_i1:112-837(+)